MLCKVMRKEKEFLTVKEASQILGVNPETLRRWDKKGKLKAKRHPMNNYRIYKAREIERIMSLIVAEGNC